MWLKDVVTIGEIFEIKLTDGSTRTKLLEILEDDEFVVYQPTLKGLLVWTESNQVFSFTFYRADGVYTFDAQNKKTYLKDGVRACRFKQVSEVRKLQRRQAFRLRVVLSIIAESIEDEQEENDRKIYKGKTTNISEKSVQLTCYQPLPEDTMVNATIDFDKRTSIILKARVLRCVKPEKKSDPYNIVLLFTDCLERDIVNLRRFILKQQINSKGKRI